MWRQLLSLSLADTSLKERRQGGRKKGVGLDDWMNKRGRGEGRRGGQRRADEEEEEERGVGEGGEREGGEQRGVGRRNKLGEKKEREESRQRGASGGMLRMTGCC